MVSGLTRLRFSSGFTPDRQFRSDLIVASAKTSKEVGDEQDQQKGAQPNTSTTSTTPSAVTVITSTAAQHQNQDNDQDQHTISPFLFTLSEISPYCSH